MIIAGFLDVQPSDIWHDPLFQFGLNIVIAVLAVIISSFVAIWIYRRQKSKREITYQIISDASVISIDQEIEKRVEIKLDGKAVKEVTLAVIDVWNSGNTAIKKDDYDVPIGFEFEGREVISQEIIDMEPNDLIDDDVKKKLLTSSAPNKVELAPTLFNAKELVSFSVLLNGPIGKISKRGRIIDGEIVEINLENQPVTFKIPIPVFLFILSIVVVVFLVTLSYIQAPYLGLPYYIVLTIFMIFVFAFIIFIPFIIFRVIFQFITNRSKITNIFSKITNIFKNGLKITW